jgi:L-iditol 2-dehydrogenase
VARLHGVGDIRVADEPLPRPGPGEELVEVAAVGICGSDLHWYTEGAIGDAHIGRPLVLGHEIAGTIAAGPRAGLRVAVDPAIPCWACSPCRDGNPNLCIDIRFAGHGAVDGGLRRFMTWPADRLHPVPDDLDSAAVAMLEPLGVALHAVDLAGVRIGADAAVVGCGPIGLLTVQLLQVAGARRVIAVEPLPHRRAMAAHYGAVTVDSTKESPASPPGDPTADVVFETAGTDAAVAHAIDLCRPGGRVALVGIPDDDRTAFPASTARRKGLTLMLVRRMKEMYPRTIALLASRRIRLDGLVSEYSRLDQTAEAFRVAAARSGHKVVVRP